MAGAFVRLVFEAAPHGERVDLDGLPDRLVAQAEKKLDEGRADLSFADEAGHWHVIFEIKVHAGYGPNQIVGSPHGRDGS